MEAFFGDVVRLTMSGRPVITADIVRDAFDVLRLTDRQRERVVRLKTRRRSPYSSPFCLT